MHQVQRRWDSSASCIQLVCTDFLLLFPRMLKAIHRDSGMVDLNTSLTIIIYYVRYPILFRRKEQIRERLRVGPRKTFSIRDIIENDLNPKNSECIMDVVIASICSDARFRGQEWCRSNITRS